jgi:hypothetical protein
LVDIRIRRQFLKLASVRNSDRPDEVRPTMSEDEIIAEGRRYVAVQQAKIQRQREFIIQLESRGGDAQTVQMQKETLGEMVKSLDLLLNRLRPVIDNELRQPPTEKRGDG